MLAGLTAGMLSGCADYMRRQDTVTAAAGDAQDWNKAVHTTDPWPPYVMNTHISGDGQRVSTVIKRYSAGPAPTSGSPAAASAAPAAPGQ